MINIKNLTRLTSFFPQNKYYFSGSMHPNAQHYTEMMIRAQRRRFLNRVALSHNKIVINAELRKKTDGVVALKNKGKCPGVIHSLSEKEEDQIDVVVDGKIMKNLMKSMGYMCETVYVKLEGKEYRCIFKKGHMWQNQFIRSVDFQIYEVGKPNKLSIPVECTHLTENPYLQEGGIHTLKKKTVNIICYNQEYPKRLFVDLTYVSPERCFRVGDFALFLPPGLLLDESESSRVVTVKGRDLQEQIYKHQKFKRMKEAQEKGKKQEVKGGQKK